jgi:hypothetical protein
LPFSIIKLKFLLLLCFEGFTMPSQAKDNSARPGGLKISGITHPAIPFYHFKADLELPEASMIEVEAVVDGKTLRFVNLYGGLSASSRTSRRISIARRRDTLFHRTTPFIKTLSLPHG